MKRADEMSDRELLVRIDERIKHLPVLTKTVTRHDRELLVAKVLFVVILVALAKSYPWISEALAKVLG